MKDAEIQLNNSSETLTQGAPAGGIGIPTNIIWGKRTEPGKHLLRA